MKKKKWRCFPFYTKDELSCLKLIIINYLLSKQTMINCQEERINGTPMISRAGQSTIP